MSTKTDYEILNKITADINRNEYIHDTAHVSIQIKSTGQMFRKKNIIQIIGRVDQPREKEEIEKIVNAHSGNMEVVSTLRVENR
jgi:hypothetical protein